MLKHHLLGDQLSLPTCGKWHPPAFHWTCLPFSTITLPPPEIRALCNQPQAPKCEPHQIWPRSLLLITVPPCLGWRGQKGDPLEEIGRGRGWHRQCRPEKGPPLRFGVPAACSAPSQVSCRHLMEESIGDSVPKVKRSGPQTVPRGAHCPER